MKQNVGKHTVALIDEARRGASVNQKRKLRIDGSVKARNYLGVAWDMSLRLDTRHKVVHNKCEVTSMWVVDQGEDA